MAVPNRRAAESPTSLPSQTVAESARGLFFGPETNTATDELSASGARCSSVEITAAVVDTAAVEQNTPVATTASVVDSNPVANIAPVANYTPVAESTAVVDIDSVANSATSEDDPSLAVLPLTAAPRHAATGAQITTGARLPSGARIWRPRPIRRITDGLTPGQYAVYRLMYEAAEGAGESPRIYTGGYADLRRLTGLSKRGIQNIVAELQNKQVLRVHQRPGYHRTQTTAYAVPGAEGVLQIWAANGWRNAIGKSKTLSG